MERYGENFTWLQTKVKPLSIPIKATSGKESKVYKKIWGEVHMGFV